VHQARYEDTYEALANQCYWDYVRVLTPPGTKLLQLSGTDQKVDVTEVAGKVSFGTLVVVPAGETKSFQLAYRLPQGYVDTMQRDRRYQLLVQKTPGTPRTVGTVRLFLPEDRMLVAGSTPFEVTAPGQSVASIIAATDVSLEATWRPDSR
jgi:hypothetical protein